MDKDHVTCPRVVPCQAFVCAVDGSSVKTATPAIGGWAVYGETLRNYF